MSEKRKNGMSMKRKARLIAAMDRLRREHYGDIPLTGEELKEVRAEVDDTLGRSNGVLSKEARKFLVKIGWEGYDTAVLWRLLLLMKCAAKIHGGDREAMYFEWKMYVLELCEALSGPSAENRVACHAKIAKPNRNLPAKEAVFEAVANSYKAYRKKGMLRPEALKKAIADNIDDVRALGLWRTNRGRPNEGEPGSGWKACYQVLYEKGYLKA